MSENSNNDNANSGNSGNDANNGNNSGGGKQVTGDDVKNAVMGDWMTPSPGDGDKDPLMCGEKGWHFGMFDGCCNGGVVRFCQRWYCGACMYSRALGVALDQNCCLCCLCTGWWYCGWCAVPCCRAKIREKYGIQGGNLLCDLLKCWFCNVCIVQQLIHEVNEREKIHVGPFGDPAGTWNVKIDCGNDIPGAKIGTELNTGNSMER
eukprot:INCI824.1.p1 GENE.INCI824.1~~INCI824.1.p1  ORF type:complete len:206 (+),score=31.67 INCI824.1:129-746(+)